MDLIATTGSSLDAENAGINPDIIPISPETNIPNPIFEKVRENVMSIIEFAINTSRYTNVKPANPPMRHNKMDSNKNCSKIK